MAKPSLPNPQAKFVDEEGKITDVWYRYLSQELTQSNSLTDIVGGLSTGTTGLTAVAFSSFATQAEQEAGATSTAVVTPSVQQYHPSASKAWGCVTMAGTVATLEANYNVNTVACTAAGLLRVDLTNSFGSTSYVVLATARNSDSGSQNKAITVLTSIGLASTTFTLLNQDSTGANDTPDGWFFTCYGDQ